MVQLDFGGKTRTLKFDIKALKDLEAQMDGRPLGAVIGQWMNVGVTAIVAGLWAGLKHEDATLTPGLIGKMLQSHIEAKKPLKPIGRALSQAIDETGLLRTEDEESEGNAPAAEA